MNLKSYLQHSWNIFMNKDPTSNKDQNGSHIHYFTSGSSYYNPSRVHLTGGRNRSIITPIYNRIALDVAQLSVMHVQLDDQKRFKEEINSGLNNCLTLEANIDQTADAFMQDVVLSLFDEGCVAIVPIETDMKKGALDICSLRTGKIVEWFPKSVKVNLYNELTGKKEDVILPKSKVTIVENPFYAVMNEPNSTMQRLIRKLALLDITDEKVSSGKLDLLITLPHITRTELQKTRAKERTDDIAKQLVDSPYGIAYIDGSEKVTQLNRPVDNQLLKQIENLTNQLFSQLGLTMGILDGTADEKTMTYYYKRTVLPVAKAIIDSMKVKFLTKTARTQGESIMLFIDHLEFIPPSQLAEIADVLCRNEIVSSNEIRQTIGRKPSEDPKADMLHNSNMPYPDESPEFGDLSSMDELLSTFEESIGSMDSVLGQNGGSDE